jgi:hypothetical protein
MPHVSSLSLRAFFVLGSAQVRRSVPRSAPRGQRPAGSGSLATRPLEQRGREHRRHRGLRRGPSAGVLERDAPRRRCADAREDWTKMRAAPSSVSPLSWAPLSWAPLSWAPLSWAPLSWSCRGLPRRVSPVVSPLSWTSPSCVGALSGETGETPWPRRRRQMATVPTVRSRPGRRRPQARRGRRPRRAYDAAQDAAPACRKQR